MEPQKRPGWAAALHDAWLSRLPLPWILSSLLFSAILLKLGGQQHGRILPLKDADCTILYLRPRSRDQGNG